jgi:hypothetical protein
LSTLDPGKKKNRIQNKHPGSATLLLPYLEVSDENLLGELELPQNGRMEGAEDPLVQVAKVIVSPADRAHFNGGFEVTE